MAGTRDTFFSAYMGDFKMVPPPFFVDGFFICNKILGLIYDGHFYNLKL
jgi:hypothetical protein